MSLKPKTTPKRTVEKTALRGKEKQPQGAIAARVALFKALDSLCCCMISCLWLFRHLLHLLDSGDLPLHSPLDGCWPCLTMGGRMRKPGERVSTSACTGQAPAQAGIHR